MDYRIDMAVMTLSELEDLLDGKFGPENARIVVAESDREKVRRYIELRKMKVSALEGNFKNE